jgi:CBS domain-containing protein
MRASLGFARDDSEKQEEIGPMQVREIMTPGAELIDANATIRDAAVKMRDEDLGALPVGDGAA